MHLTKAGELPTSGGAPAVSAEAGAPEITPAMIQAGVRVYTAFMLGKRTAKRLLSESDFVAEVYRVMWHAGQHC